MTNNKVKGVCGAVILSALVSSSFAGSDEEFTKPFGKPTSMTMLLSEKDTSSSSFNLLDKYVNKEGGLTEDKLKISGVTRFLTIYRSMQESYVDMINADKNFSFTDYPLASVGSNAGANGAYPMLELNLQSKLTRDFDFSIGYSLSHTFSGNLTEGLAQNINAVQNLNFKASHRADWLKSTIYAGEVLWTNLSRFTMGQPEYRDNYFNRLPWDWYRNSFTRYSEYYSLSNNIGQQQLGNSPLQGFIGEFEVLPLQLNFKALYGRTNRSVALSKSVAGFPSYTQGYRVEKLIFERQIRGKAGLNFYQKSAEVDFTGGLIDRNTVGSLDFGLKVANKVNVSGEFGYGKLENPYFDALPNDNGTGAGGVLKLEFDRRAVLWPFSVEYYHIQNNLVSLDGGILNSNKGAVDGGFATEAIYDNVRFTNISNEVGQLANNRSGVNLKLEATIKDLKVQFGYSISQELSNAGDTITIQHRVNPFSRSRFRPWFQAGGPYARIKSAWMRTFETITIGNEFYDPTNRELLGFNTIELFLKYKLKLGKKHELVLLNFTSVNSVKEGFNVFSNIDKNTYTTVLFDDFTAAFKLTEKITLVGYYGIENFRGSIRTNLSPDKAAVYDALGNPTNTEDRIINQWGSSYAAGIDYDFNKTTSLHLRSKYMTHEDKNFTKDKFSGFETNLELKIFF